MTKIKKIYVYKNALVSVCKWCNGTGIDQVFTDQHCFTCKGAGGRWEQRKVLVGEEVIE